MFPLCFIVFKLLLYFIYILFVDRRSFCISTKYGFLYLYLLDIRLDMMAVKQIVKYPSPRIASHVSNEWQTLHAVL